jgi:glycine/D-amino acid oxidase-like deaminating enzyme
MTNTVIIGSGIIGLSTAIYLSESPRSQAQNIHLVEASPELFHYASGLAGGFLAEDCSLVPRGYSHTFQLIYLLTGFAPAVAPVGALSFRLHRELAEKYGGAERWGYSRGTAASLTRNQKSASKPGARGEDWIRDGGSRAAASGIINEFVTGVEPLWLTKEIGNDLEVVSEEGTVAQVDPKRLCRFLLDAYLERGVKLYRPAKVVKADKNVRDKLSGVRMATDNGDEVDGKYTWVKLARSSCNSDSSLHTPCDHGWRMVALNFQTAVFQLHIFNTDHTVGRSLSSHQITAMAQRTREEWLPCCLRNRHPRIFSRDFLSRR